MKKDILKIAGVKSEKEFYKKYPTEAAFMKAHKKEFKKAAMGASMVQKQLTQLTDFSNPPKAEVGDYIGGGQSSYKPMNYTELYDSADYANTGSNRKMRMEDQALAAQQAIAKNSGKGILDQLMGGLKGMTGGLDALSSGADTGGLGAGGVDAGGYTNGINETGASFADVGKYGKRLRRAQGGDMISQFGPQLTSYKRGNISSPTGQVSKQQTEALGFKSDGSNYNTNKFALGMKNFGKDVGEGYDKLDSSLGNIGGVSGALGVGTDLLEGFQQLKKEKQQKQGAHQAFELSGLTKQVAGLTPDIAQRKYVRPEDQAFGTQQLGQAYGVGTNYLARNGMQVGGNPTEIQNMYNPGDIYSDMGYEPLSDSEVVKQYRKGGLIPKAQMGGPFDKMAGQAGGALGSLIGGGHGRPTAGGKIGSTIGSTAGNLILPGVGGIIGGAIGGIAGGIIGGKSAAETENWETGAQQNTDATAFMSGAQGLHNQFGNVMEDGGDVGLKYLSHDWQPQVITQFGDYDMKDLLRDDPTMDTLRSGGNLKDYRYTPLTESAMSTERPSMQMGGELTPLWGGDIVPVSYNPYMEGDGYTYEAKGNYHNQSDGNGNTGVGMDYGGSKVEVQPREPIFETGGEVGSEEKSATVLGGIKMPSYSLSEINEGVSKKLQANKNQTYQAYGRRLNDQEIKNNKIISDLASSIDGLDLDDPLVLKSIEMKSLGADMSLAQIAEQKKKAAYTQAAIHEAKDEMSERLGKPLEVNAFAKGLIKTDKKAMKEAKFGGKFTQAQNGNRYPSPVDESGNYYMPGYEPYQEEKFTNLPEITIKGNKPVNQPLKKVMGKDLSVIAPDITAKVPDYAKNLKSSNNISIDGEKTKDRFGIEDVLRQVQPYLIPSNQEAFDYGSISPELNALLMNTPSAVQAQTFQPILGEMPSVSFQDQLNEIQAEANAARRMAGTNPAAQAMISAQAASAKNKVLAEQLRTNQLLQAENRAKNIGLLNEATLKNFDILDKQYVRQETAKSKTKEQAQSALASIASKIGQHKLENRTLGVYENMYNYRFGPKGRAINVNAPYEFNLDVASLSPDELETAKKFKELQEKKGTNKAKMSKNGSIVKAIKNL